MIIEKKFSCDFTTSIQTNPYRGFKTDLKKACSVSLRFLGTRAGRSLNKKNTGLLCVALVICGNHKMRRLNDQHRKKRKTTDVLSFPQFTDWAEVSSFPQVYLGDIVICYDVWAKQARDHNISLREEFFHLFFHGFLHLLDYDHERSQKDAKAMFKLENELVKKAMRS